MLMNFQRMDMKIICYFIFSLVLFNAAHLYSQTVDGTFEGTYTAEQTISNWRVGAVIAYATAIASMKLYYGINIGIILSSTSFEMTGEDSEDNSKTDFFVGPAIGGEYMFSDNFSLGGEIQINYISVGQFDEDLPQVSQLMYRNP